MKKVKYVVLGLICVGLTSCGIFKKGCGCPKFGDAVHKTSIHAPNPVA